MSRIPKPIREALEACGLPYEIEAGTKHLKVRVGGRMATILPRGAKAQDGGPNSVRNAIANIRRVAGAQTPQA